MGQLGDKLKKKASGIKSYVILTGVVILLLAIACTFICILTKSIQSLTWPSTQGMILKSVVIRKGSGTEEY